jgi:hypothetical protein
MAMASAGGGSASPGTLELLGLLVDLTGPRCRFGVRDDRGHSMDTLKVIESPAGGYLGVYHCATGDGFEVHLATSADLLTWQHQVLVETTASQPTIAAVPDGGFLLAMEAGGNGRPIWLRFKHYADLARLLAGAADRVFDAPHTQVPLGRLAEGTPNIYSATFLPDLDHSVIDVGFHYYRDGDVDRQARGTLRDFRDWTTIRVPRLDAAIEECGVSGNIGGRDFFTWRGEPYSLIEGQSRKGRWESWRVYLFDWSADAAYPVRLRTRGGSTAFGNPTLTMLRAPSGEPAVFLTAFVFTPGAAPGEAGPLLHYRELPGDL